jgi:hypothetical protein
MINTDARAAAWNAWLDDLEGDTRLPQEDRDFLTAMKTKLGSGPTDPGEDSRMVYVSQKLFMLINNY